MAKYSQEFKEKVVCRLMPPNAESVAQVHRDTGMSEATLYLWRNEYRDKGMAVPADPSNPENWSGENKLAVVIETALLNEVQLGEYYHKKGDIFVDKHRYVALLKGRSGKIYHPFITPDRSTLSNHLIG